MPSLRSTRSRQKEQENSEIKFNQNKNTKEENAIKTTRAGRALAESRKGLKEINTNKQETKQKKKDKTSKKIVKGKMVLEDGSEKDVEAATADIPKTDVENINDNAKSPEKDKAESEPMEVQEEEQNENCSPPKIGKFEDSGIANETENAKVTEKAEDEDKKQENLDLEKENDENDQEKHKNKNFSLKSHSNRSSKTIEETDPSTSSSNLPKHLMMVISNLYLNVGKRLHLDFPPRCLDDLAYCHRHHYRSDLPEAPIPSQAHSLRSALQHYRYNLFINSTTGMCHRGEFPGKGIFTKIMELVLSINYVTNQPNNIIAIFQQSYHKSIELFTMVVRTFPPCWHKMRPYYVGFLEYGLDLDKLKTNKEEALSKSSKIFDIILDLLEDVLKKSSPEDLKEFKSETIQSPLKMNGLNQDITSPMNNSELSICSEYWNQNEYEERERQKQTFDALPVQQKLERVFVALKLLLQILENDLAMWMLHHNKKTKEWIFCSDNRPLIVVLCELTQYTRMTRVARRIFTVYSEAAAKGLCKRRLKILERYISLIMEASNTADMENTAIGVKYPFLGDQTKTLINEFFKIFKAHNREEISKYMETIELLQTPYVRYEFIDNLLIMFQFTNSETLTPQKIALDVAKKRWLKYKPAAELANPDEDISREQYLHLLLDALRCYSDFHGSKTFLHVITETTTIAPLTTTNDSAHRWPTHGTGVLVLKKMAKDINMLEGQLRMAVRMSKPKVDLPLADIYIDEDIILKYRTDLKFIISLQNVVLKQKDAYADVDFSAWLEFFNDFSPKKITKYKEST